MSTKYDASELTRESRLAALQRTELLEAPVDAHLDRVTRLVSRLLSVPTALLSLVEADRQFFSSQCGLPEPFATTRQTPMSHSFCQYVVSSGQPFVVRDARREALLQGNLAVSELGVVSYLGVPVRDAGGEILGSLCAIDGRARDWTPDDVSLMKDVAGIVEDVLALRSIGFRARALAIENGILAREYHHRVKNALAVSAALVKLSARGAPSIDALVDVASARLSALANAHDALMLESDDVDLGELANRLLAPYRGPDGRADISGPEVSLRHDQVTPMCLFLHELATNSAKYGAFSQDRRVSLDWSFDRDLVQVVWSEDAGGAGGPDGFGSELLKAAGRQLGGTCEAKRSASELRVVLRFPRPDV